MRESNHDKAIFLREQALIISYFLLIAVVIFSVVLVKLKNEEVKEADKEIERLESVEFESSLHIQMLIEMIVERGENTIGPII
tara:strand:+ start:117 stop:365 length:249 start_codon:yes stop_codon:yes gene_type:complete